MYRPEGNESPGLSEDSRHHSPHSRVTTVIRGPSQLQRYTLWLKLPSLSHLGRCPLTRHHLGFPDYVMMAD